MGKPRARRTFLANLGDRSPLDYGAAILWKERNERYPRMMLVSDPQCSICGNESCSDHYNGTGRNDRYEVRFWDIENDVRSDLSWLTDDDVANMSRSLDCDWLALAESSDVLARAQAYLCVAEYFGADNLDSYPVMLTRTDMWRYHGAMLRHAMRD